MDDSQFHFRTGYQRTYLVLNRVLNVVLALFLILLAAPFFLVVPLVILIWDGRPILYRSKRLGKDKRPFTMLKFRTLRPEADALLQGQLVMDRHQLVTGPGKLLRDTRLDELPQLFNVLRGDMDFLGPRPERPEVYQRICRHIPGYDKRFAVNPGLLGLSQVFTPHSSPKRIRTFIDNRLVRKKQHVLWDLYAVMLTGFVVLRTIVVRLARSLRQDLWERRIRGRYKEKRRLDRRSLSACRAFVRLEIGSDADQMEGRVVDMNEQAFLLETQAPIPLASGDSSEEMHKDPVARLFRLETSFKCRNGEVKRKTARCLGRILRGAVPDGDGRWRCVVEYEPLTPLNSYILHQYFLRKSMAFCR